MIWMWRPVRPGDLAPGACPTGPPSMPLLTPRMVLSSSSGLIEIVVMFRCQTAQRGDMGVTGNRSMNIYTGRGCRDPGEAPRCHRLLDRRHEQDYGWTGMHNDAVRWCRPTGSPSEPSWDLLVAVVLSGSEDRSGMAGGMELLNRTGWGMDMTSKNWYITARITTRNCHPNIRTELGAG